MPAANRNAFCDAFRSQFKLDARAKVAPAITSKKLGFKPWSMPDDKASIQQRMHEGYASNVQRPEIAEKTVQAKQDDKRRAQHFKFG